MADEMTETPNDTANSPTNEAEAASTEQQGANDAPADGEGSDADNGETSVLGGDVADEGEGAAEAASDDETAGPPEKYELALEGVTLDQEAVAAAEPVFRELGLSNDQANKLMPAAKDFAERTAQATLAQIVEAGAAQKKEWLDAFAADPDIGGAKREETEHLAARALDSLGYPQGHAFRKALTETGFGNHPEMIRVFRRIGEMVGEDGFERSNAGASEPQPTESRWYGNKGD